MAIPSTQVSAVGTYAPGWNSRTPSRGSHRNHSVGTANPGVRASVVGARSASARSTALARTELEWSIGINGTETGSGGRAERATRRGRSGGAQPGGGVTGG